MLPSAQNDVSVDGLDLVHLVMETGVGLVAILVVTTFHGFFSARILFGTEKANLAHLSAQRLRAVAVRFYLSILALVLVHIGEIFIWASSLTLFQLTDNLLDALLIAGSTYTTVGFDTAPLRAGWKFYPVFIAVSGLFNFAWSTGTMMTLLAQYREAFKRSHKV